MSINLCIEREKTIEINGLLAPSVNISIQQICNVIAVYFLNENKKLYFEVDKWSVDRGVRPG